MELLAVIHDRLVAVGKEAEIRPLIGPKTPRPTSRGGAVPPGFYDNHRPPARCGSATSRLIYTTPRKDEKDFGERLKTFAAKTPRDRWYLGR